MFPAVSYAQTVRIRAVTSDAPANVSAAGAVGAPSLALPASYVTLSLADGLPTVSKAPVISPRQSLSVGAENVGRAPSPLGANAALDGMYMASKAKPGAVVAASYAPSMSAPSLKPSDSKTSARKEEVPSRSDREEEPQAGFGAQLAVAAAAIAALSAAAYFMAQAFTSMVIQWEAELRAAQDFWSQMP